MHSKSKPSLPNISTDIQTLLTPDIQSSRSLGLAVTPKPLSLPVINKSPTPRYVSLTTKRLTSNEGAHSEDLPQSKKKRQLELNVKQNLTSKLREKTSKETIFSPVEENEASDKYWMPNGWNNDTTVDHGKKLESPKVIISTTTSSNRTKIKKPSTNKKETQPNKANSVGSQKKNFQQKAQEYTEKAVKKSVENSTKETIQATEKQNITATNGERIRKPSQNKEPLNTPKDGSKTKKTSTSLTKYPIKCHSSAHQIFGSQTTGMLRIFSPDVDVCESGYNRTVFKTGVMQYFIGRVAPKDISLNGRQLDIEGGMYLWIDEIDSWTIKHAPMDVILELEVQKFQGTSNPNIQVIPLKKTNKEFMGIIHSGKFPATTILDLALISESKQMEQRETNRVRVDITSTIERVQQSKRSSVLFWIRMDPIMKQSTSVQTLFPVLCYQKR